MKYNQNKNIIQIKQKLSMKQKLEIIINKLLNIKRISIALIGLIPMPYLDEFLSKLKPINDFNNIYNKTLIILHLDTIPIIKDLTGNIILTGIVYVIILITCFKNNSLQKKAEQCKELKITDNGKNNGNTIIPIKEYCDRKNKIKTLLCFSNGVVKQDFENNNNLDKLSKKWNQYIIDVEDYKKDKLKIFYKNDRSKNINVWDNSLLDKDDFVIVLGKDDKGNIKKFDFNITPSMIISSASGGGKTTLFKNIMIQCYLKGAKIIIADFKGGLDFNKGWNKLNSENCKIITNVDTLWDYLIYDIPDIVKDRKYILNKYECSDIKEFNKKVENKEITESKIDRIIIGIDEAAEIFTKTRDKEKEKVLEQVRGKLDEVAYLYRAVGIHLIISTQVPSSQVLTESIRHNALMRICGRANKILSQIAIEKDIASTIKPEERGRFATSEDENPFFQGYIFDDKKILEEIINQKK